MCCANKTPESSLQNERRIRCNITNALLTPQIFSVPKFEDQVILREEERSLRMQPRVRQRPVTIDQPVYHPFVKDSGLFRIIYCLKGSGLLIPNDGSDQVVAPGTFLILPPGYEPDLLVGRGEAHGILAFWEPESNYVLSDHITEMKVFVAAECNQTLQSFTQQIAANPDSITENDNLLQAWINLVIAEASSIKPNRSFTLGNDGYESISGLDQLLEAIREAPERDWNLNAAAEFAGYSPFHLSRTFRATIGIGLPNFVELRRAEAAIQRLLTTNDPINVVAFESGFGSSQAMRSAIRENTGLLPTEIRGRAGE